MSATETLTTNERVLGADPFVEYRAARGREGDSDYEPAVPGGIGEEDFLTIVLPYVTTAREGVQRLGDLLKEYGTYEMNGVAFSDADEIWWMETVGGHHWIAKRVPDEAYVTMPNQLGIDEFDLDDALGEQENHMCSEDLVEFIERNHLDLSVESTSPFNPRDAFGSHSDSDHVYNTPRAWVMQRFLNPYDEMWDGPEADHRPDSDDIPWARQPERKVTIEDVKYVLSSHYQARRSTRTATSATSTHATCTARSASTARASWPSCRFARTVRSRTARSSGSPTAPTRSTRWCRSTRTSTKRRSIWKTRPRA